MIPMPIPHKIFEILGVDLVGPLHKTTSGYEYVIVITDYLTKFVIAKPLRRATTENIIEVLKTHVFYVFGYPGTLVTDNGANLISSSMRRMLDYLKITHRTTSAYRPQTNGQVERYNRVLGTQLTIFASEKPGTWNLFLDALVFAYNTTIHASHLNTPYKLVFGQDPNKPIDSVTGKERRFPTQLEAAATQEEVTVARKLARDLITKNQIKAKLRYDKNRVQTDYAIGDLVLARVHVIKGEKKFTYTWKGPFTIVKRLNDVNYQVKGNSNYDENIVHISNIKRYTPRRSESNKGEGTPSVVEKEEVSFEE